MMNANGETRRLLAVTVGCAFLSAIATKLGELVVDRVRARVARKDDVRIGVR